MESYVYIKSKLEQHLIKSRTRVMQKSFRLYLYFSFLHLKLDFRYSSLSFVKLS